MGIKRYRNAIRKSRADRSYLKFIDRPVSKDIILFEAGQGRSLEGQIFALLSCCKFEGKQKYISVRSNNRSLIVSRLKDIGITDVKTVVRDSTKYRFLLATTSEIVTDDALPPYFIKKKEQKLTVLCHDLCNRKKGRSCLNEANDLGLIQKTLLEADELKFTDEVNERSVKHEFMISFLAGDRTEIIPNVYYAGDLTRPENCFLIEEVLRKGKTDESDNKHVVILFEKSIRPAVSEFIKKYNQKAEFIQITAEGAVSFMDRVWQNLYRNHGWFRKKAEQLYVREYRRNFRVIDRKSLSVNVVNTDLYERIEELLLCNSKKVFHRIPPLFYRQLTDVFVARPEKLEQIADRFDEKIAYDIEFANKIWKDVPCTGIYLKPSKIKISSDFDNIYLKMKLKIATPKGEKIMEPDGSFIIGSTIHEKIFEYPVKFSGDGSFSVSFPKKELNGWYINNLPMLGFKTPWGRIRVPILTSAKLGENAYSTGSGNAFVIRRSYRYLRIIIREDIVTDRLIEKIKLGTAFVFHLITPWYRPVLFYEKYCMNYEESASVLFEKLVDMEYTNLKYVLNRNSFALNGIAERYLKHFAYQYSFSHYYNLFAAKSIISSEAIGHALEKGTSSMLFRNFVADGSKNYVFLQHGVMYMVALSSEQRTFFNKAKGKGRCRVVVSSHLEANHFTSSTDYQPEEIYISGLIKFDRSVLNEDADIIMVMLTWRPWEFVTGTNNIKDTAYYKMLKRIVDAVPDNLKDRLVVMPHPLLARQADIDNEDEVWKYYVPEVKYDELLKRTKLLITDYSSISYDAFYRGSNVIFDWEEKDECMREYGENGRLMLTEELAFGDICKSNSELRETIEKVYGSNQIEEYKKRYSKLVEFHDGKNSERFIEMAKRDGIL